TSTPALSISPATSTVRSREGSPAVTKPTNPLRPCSRKRRNRSPIRLMRLQYSQILVAAPAQVDQHELARERRRLPRHPGDGVGRLQGGDDPLPLGEQMECGER